MLTQLINEINTCFGSDKPFSHFRGEKFWTPEVYKEMLRLLPDESLYKDLLHKEAIYDQGSTRKSFTVDKEGLRLLDDERRAFWEPFAYMLRSQAVQDAIFGRLKKDIVAKWGTISPPCKPTVIFYRDIAGYRISPHTDKRKVVTTQFYLPEDDSISDVGTELYTKIVNGVEVYHKMEFRPFYGYGFAVSDKSWHGVSEITTKGVVRNSLMLIYYV